MTMVCAHTHTQQWNVGGDDFVDPPTKN